MHHNEIHAERNLAGVEPVGLSVSNSNKFDASLTGRYARVREMTQVFSSDARAAWGAKQRVQKVTYWLAMARKDKRSTNSVALLVTSAKQRR